MAVVVVQPAAGQAPTAVRRVLAAAGLASRTLPPADDAGPSDGLTGVEGLIVLGAAAPALLQEALAAEVPVLALEPGTRLLVREPDAAPGVRPGTAPDRPPVELTRAAGSDPLFAGATPPSPGLRPACDPLELPAGAVVLASCDGYPDQAFRIGPSAWGVRFLPHDLPLDPWGEQLLGRFARLVADRATHTATRAFFTRRADAWEERFAYQTPAYDAAVARLRLAPGARAVDLGCGTGRAMPALRAQVGTGGQVVGVDLTPAMLTAAARHGRTRHGSLLAADCTRLPLAAASVDGIFSAGLLDHLPEPAAALREWARVTAADGVLLLFHPSGRAERAARHGRPLDPGDLLAEGNLRRALEATGWHLEEYEDAAGHFLARALPRR
ncbi:methyltransferase type 11 [Streptomyces venezuelae]|uniref:Methyltransferase type 11 n=1 Tax=Streptomyces venezuelae TaxID=54571 RepID=A0A5P2DY49_STRVZ|nr:methyltransferase domain-containing protein [Streptomyces venezuelae]QES58211.1 methyltransferase type 11 [Streptomyces venezuelae]